MDTNDLEQLKKKLPLTPGILGKEKLFNSSVLIPLVLKNKEYYFLFQKRAKNIRQGGEICFPGGKIDPGIDKTPRDTAIRETIEELGIKKKNIKITGRLDTLVTALGISIDPFIGTLELNNINELNINKDEVEEVFLLPVRHFCDNPPENYHIHLKAQPHYYEDGEKIVTFPAKELGLPDRYSNTWGSIKHKILLYPTGKGAVWGMTAELIYEVVRKLQ